MRTQVGIVGAGAYARQAPWPTKKTSHVREGKLKKDSRRYAAIVKARDVKSD